MIRENALVTSIDGPHAWVQTQRQSACESCAAEKGCGTSTIGKVIGRQYTQVKALNECHAKVGDTVEVALAEDMLLKGSAAVYVVPLVLMLIFAIAAEYLFGGQLSEYLNQFVAPFGALLGGAVGMLWLKFFSSRVSKDSRFQPVCEKVVERGDLKIKTVYTP